MTDMNPKLRIQGNTGNIREIKHLSMANTMKQFNSTQQPSYTYPKKGNESRRKSILLQSIEMLPEKRKLRSVT